MLWSPAPRLRALRTLLRQRGWTVALLFATHRLLNALTGGRAALVPYLLMAQPIGAGTFSSVRDDPATVVRRAVATDPIAARLPRETSVNESRWNSGADCHVATVKDRFAGTIWTQRERYLEDEVRCEFVIADPESGVWDFDVYIDPSFRLGRTLARLWKCVDNELAAQGVRWSFSRVSLFNVESISAHGRLGAVRVGWACFLVVGPLQLTIHDQRGHLHLSLREQQRPSLQLRAPPRPRS